jgi:DNA polymerase-3 subunit beta
LVSQPELASAIAAVKAIVPLRPTHPVLANLLLELQGDVLNITAFDLRLGLKIELVVNGEQDGRAALPARLFSDVISGLDGQVAIAFDEACKATITAQSGHYSIHGMEADEFTPFPSLDEDAQILEIPTPALHLGLEKIAFAMATNGTKQVLCGARFQGGDCGEFASTDGHRLSVISLDDIPGIESGVNLPRRTVLELERLTRGLEGLTTLSYDAHAAIFKFSNMILRSPLVDGQYPAYRQLIPKKFDRQFVCDRRSLISSLERVAVIADQKGNHIVKFQMMPEAGALKISVEAQDVGTGEETLNAQIQGGDLEIAFNVKYVLESLKNIDSTEVIFHLNTPTSPVIITPLGTTQTTHLIMPVQIRS